MVKENDLIGLNRQLDRLGYKTLGDLVKGRSQIVESKQKRRKIRGQ